MRYPSLLTSANQEELLRRRLREEEEEETSFSIRGRRLRGEGCCSGRCFFWIGLSVGGLGESTSVRLGEAGGKEDASKLTVSFLFVFLIVGDSVQSSSDHRRIGYRRCFTYRGGL